MGQYPKRLIEVDLPIKRISAHARREKSIRHGHISTLHIWWARRPLAACRAVICAALWPDPADELCPDSFRKAAREEIKKWVRENLQLLSEDSIKRFVGFQKDPGRLDDYVELRKALLDFIADFANWDNSSIKEYLDTSRALTQAAHEALGGAPGTRPLIVDPFAGGGSIPLEALRIGADTFASDLNPVAVLLNKVLLEYIPKHGKRLAQEVKKWGIWVKKQAEKELEQVYPKDPDGAIPIAYLWARTIRCEGPGCGAVIPLIRSLQLSKKFRLKLNPLNKSQLTFEVVEGKKNVRETGTVQRGSAVCPLCGYTTHVSSVRKQMRSRRGGSNDARLIAVVLTRPGQNGRSYRVATDRDMEIVKKASEILEIRNAAHKGEISLIPDESTSHYHTFVNRGPIYGFNNWGAYFTDRQLLALVTVKDYISQIGNISDLNDWPEISIAVKTCLALCLDRLAFYNNALAYWVPRGEYMGNIMPRQAIAMTFDFAECVATSESTGGLGSAVDWVHRACEANCGEESRVGLVQLSSATVNPLPDKSVDAFITDPPYYYSVQYADLADFFYVWLRRTVGQYYPELLSSPLIAKEDEIIVQSPSHEFATEGKNRLHYESRMKKAMSEGCRILSQDGIGIVVFAHTSTSGWESQLQAMVSAGWTVTGSWPIDTEMATRVLSIGRSVLASSIHLVCRPRQNQDTVGDWRDLLSELPERIHDWMPRLAEEGIVGADAIFACLGPSLEIFSRYSWVEKTSGELVTLKEYLEHVWAIVAKEALAMIFSGADATGFEEDARLTAMWLWTLKTGNGNASETESEESDELEEGTSSKTKPLTGFSLEYDAARKIAQGLGAHLENLDHLVDVQGETAVLLPVAARSGYLFGKDSGEVSKVKVKKKSQQMAFDFVSEIREIEKETGHWTGELKGKPGQTVLDQVHQCMILFAASRTEAMKRLLVEEGIGRNPMFWRLAQALSALYPSNTDEKRWVDGVLAKKKGLGF